MEANPNEALGEHEAHDEAVQDTEENRLDGHEKRLDEHHSRIETLEKICGVHHEADDMRSEEERGEDERHEHRQRRDEHLARRKRS